MGKVRTKLVKRVARQLLEQYPQLFTKDFSKNKEAVSKLVATKSKKLRNMIAGYVTHLISIEQKKEKLKEGASEQSAG